MASDRILYAKEDRSGFKAGKVDIVFLTLVLVLLGLGLTMLWSASYAQSLYDTGYTSSTRYLQKQAVCALLGLGAMWALSRVDASVWYRLAWFLYGGSILLLLGVLVYTAPVAFAMGSSQATSNIFKSWCRMLGGQLFLLVMNAWCLRLFTSMVGAFLANPLSL